MCPPQPSLCIHIPAVFSPLFTTIKLLQHPRHMTLPQKPHPYTSAPPLNVLRHLPCLRRLQHPKYIPPTPIPHVHFHLSMPFCTPTKSPLLLKHLRDLTLTLPPHPYGSTHLPNPFHRL
ncbi:hypothetical protein O181_101576 [Austropuccinia psidii MF-1]|uniref:Uncharacterized protein n=1 Tax=Austropuccinia psidii MF-1 TaxID=1389203 RepID=A0A9Q3PIS7_9BASI|nr:hypothetical protein [Austropuccinia psidii MF-1]